MQDRSDHSELGPPQLDSLELHFESRDFNLECGGSRVAGEIFYAHSYEGIPRLKISYLLPLLFLSSAYTFGQTRIPQFKDFPAQGAYVGKNASVIITSEDRMYRTRLKKAAQEKPNFAGHYVLTAWGCGAECLIAVVIDTNTGKVHWFPHTICCWNEIERDDSFTPIVFRLNSRLIVFTGLRNEKDGDQGAHFYEFDTTGFKYIRTIK